MDKTYEPIAAVTANGSASDYEFTSIPQTYTDLVLVIMARGAKSATMVLAQCYINFDFNTNYSNTLLTGDGSSAFSSKLNNSSGLWFGRLPAATATNGVFGTIIANFQNYSNATTFKTVLSSASNPLGELDATTGLWRSTSPITRIGVATYGDGNFVSGSTFTLYGIRAA